jgi:hypothetical protein
MYVCISFCKKNGLGYILGEFFTNSSGHTENRSPPNSLSEFRLCPTNSISLSNTYIHMHMGMYVHMHKHIMYINKACSRTVSTNKDIKAQAHLLVVTISMSD